MYHDDYLLLDFLDILFCFYYGNTMDFIANNMFVFNSNSWLMVFTLPRIYHK